MKITIYDGSCQTGQLVIDLALANGFQVSALSPKPELISFEDNNLRIYEGDFSNIEAVSQSLKDSQAAIILCEPYKSYMNGDFIDGIENFIGMMKQLHVSRLIYATNTFVRDPNDTPTIVMQILNTLNKFTAGKMYDMARMGSRSVQRSSLDWVIVRAPRVKDTQTNGVYRIGYVNSKMINNCSRENYADFIIKQITGDAWLHAMPVVSDTRSHGRLTDPV